MADRSECKDVLVGLLQKKPEPLSAAYCAPPEGKALPQVKKISEKDSSLKQEKETGQKFQEEK